MSTEFPHTTASLAAEFGIGPKALRRKAADLGIGINRRGRAGWIYSEADRLALIESMRPAASVQSRRRRQRRAA